MYRERIKQVFTKYGYIIITAADPDDEAFLEDLRNNFIKIENSGSKRYLTEIKLIGCEMDIIYVLKEHWAIRDEELEDFMSDFILI